MSKYLISKGNHYSYHIPRLFTGIRDEFELECLFYENCIYDLPGTKDDDDINKLWGFSFGYHKKNSIRLGWVYNNKTNLVDIYIYMYKNWKKEFHHIYSVGIHSLLNVKMKLETNFFYLKINDMEYTIEYDIPKIKVGYYLFPYFGGNQVAMHNTNVRVNVKG